MQYMAAHGLRRARPAELVPGTVRVISVAMPYLPQGTAPGWRDDERARAQQPGEAVISVYARGRDYHKVVRARLQRLADRLAAEIGPFGHRVFCDSAPVLEVELAGRAGLGWRGKHTLLLDRSAGSMFFLGELFVDLALPVDLPAEPHCGRCSACIDACPTAAIVAPYRLDARRCISYLTIEHPGPVAPELRVLLGNRIYGCDDCLAACPWNKFAQAATELRYHGPHGGPALAELAVLDDAGFRDRFSGSPIKRIGRDRMVRNVLYAIGNSGLAHLRPLAESLTRDPDPSVADAAQWACQRLP